VTFLIGSLIAISQSNAKKVLAYSTIGNLGLIVACAGVGTVETIAASILLMLFHAVAKSVMFLCVGSVEHKFGSKDIESWEWLLKRFPVIGAPMIIGMTGMFLPPLGMLLSKWVVLSAFASAHLIISPFLIGCVAFGSAFNLFFWTKWLGKIVSTLKSQTPIKDKVSLEEVIIIWTLAVFTVITCFSYPLITQYLIDPYLHTSHLAAFFSANSVVLFVMFAIILILPLSLLIILKKSKYIQPYMSGRNSTYPLILKQGEHFVVTDATFEASMGRIQYATLKNYYLTEFINEKRVFVTAQVITILLLVGTFMGIML
jgi:ech hydrogenase subunit A